MRIRVIMPAIIDQAGRPFNVAEADAISRRHRVLGRLTSNRSHGVVRGGPEHGTPGPVRASIV